MKAGMRGPMERRSVLVRLHGDGSGNPGEHGGGRPSCWTAGRVQRLEGEGGGGRTSSTAIGELHLVVESHGLWCC